MFRIQVKFGISRLVAIVVVSILVLAAVGSGLLNSVVEVGPEKQGGCNTWSRYPRLGSKCQALRDLINEIQGIISDLPASDFKYPADGRKQALHNKLEAVYSTFMSGGYVGAVSKLQHDIRSKMDWSDGGHPSNDWIIGLNAQATLLPLIDRLIDGDFDGDMLSMYEEFDLGTDPCSADTDNDRLLDGEEIYGYTTLQGTFITDPLDPDTDDDNAIDGHEVLDYHRYDRIETEDYYASIDAVRYYTEVVQTANTSIAPSDYSQINLELNVPWAGKYRVFVGGTGSVTYHNLKLNNSMFGLDELTGEIIVNAPEVTIRKNVTVSTPLIPFRENRTWIHLYTDTEGTEASNQTDQVRFSAHVGAYWAYFGYFIFNDTGQYNLTLRISLPPSKSVINPIYHPYLKHVTTLDIKTSFFRIFRKTIDPLDPDVDADTLMDGYESDYQMYPLNPDPDEDGISDPYEIAHGTNDELRDTDLDGIRDGVEIGLDGIFDDPYTIWDSYPQNIDGDFGSTTTNPNSVDTDDDDLPDGYVDGWVLDDEKGWGHFGQPDFVRQRWEGEDFDGDGVVDIGPWNLGQGPGETDPNSNDTDIDQLPEVWEIWYGLDPTDATGVNGAAGNPDRDADVREHSTVRDDLTGVRWPYGRAQTFKASQANYDELIIWVDNDPNYPFTEKLEVLIVGTKDGVPDPSVYKRVVALVSVPVGRMELTIGLQPHTLTVGDTYALWLRQASQASTGVLSLGFSTEGIERSGNLWAERTQQIGSVTIYHFWPHGGDADDLYFSLLKTSGLNQLTNLGEYVVGSSPRNPDADDDGAPDWPEAQVMYRTNVPDGGKTIDGYGSIAKIGGYEWIWFNRKEYGFEQEIENPPVDFAGASAKNSLVALLQPRSRSLVHASSIVVDESGEYLYIWQVSEETAWYKTFYLWERSGRTYQWSSFFDSNENDLIDSTVYVYSVHESQGLANTNIQPLLQFKDQEIYLTDPFDPHSDWDRYPDPDEPLWHSDVDGDGLANARDTDSDGDGVGDDNEARFFWQPPNWLPLNDVDNDGLDNLVDPDSDGDGVEDGLEYVYYMDLDWDGYRNMVDNDTDNDGILDGNEDSNRNGVFEPDLGETDATNPDSDNDGLWDGHNISVLVGRYKGVAIGELSVGTDPLYWDSDHDQIMDGTEVIGWYSDTWSPPRHFTSDPLDSDSDNDGLSDYLEYSSRLTDPSSADTDGDGLSDSYEDANKNGRVDPGETLPYHSDSDHDMLSDGLELGLVGDANSSSTTDPLNPDTDGDGLRDGDEDVNRNGEVESNEPDPQDEDSDDDHIWDGREYKMLGKLSYLRNPDSDGDGIIDGWDLFRNQKGSWVEAWFVDFDGFGDVNALDDDSDDDGWNDGYEDTNKNGKYEPGIDHSDPLSGDQDGDGAKDGREAAYQADPKDPDTDDDGILDGYEQDWTKDTDGDTYYNANDKDSDDDGLLDNEEDKDLDGIFEPEGGDEGKETSPVLEDSDADGLTDAEEYQYGTDPVNPDTDGDGLEDGYEIGIGTNPLSPFSDGDELTDREEDQAVLGYATDPLMSDTDEDGLYDHEEIAIGYNPLDPDMDGDGFVDGIDLQPLADWPDMYPAPTEETKTMEFVGVEYEEALEYEAAERIGYDELAGVMDQARFFSPTMPALGTMDEAIGTSIISHDMTAYWETFEYWQSREHEVVVTADMMFRELGYKVKYNPYIYSHELSEFAGTHGTLGFHRGVSTVTFENFREVPSPGGYHHRIFEWELIPESTNTITIQFSLHKDYDRTDQSETFFRLPGFGVHVYRYTGTFYEEVFSNVFPAKPLGNHLYEVDIVIPPDPSSSLRFPHETFVLDLNLVWVSNDISTGSSIEPLLPYQYQFASIESIGIVGMDYFVSSVASIHSDILEVFAGLLLEYDLTLRAVEQARAVLQSHFTTFEEFVEDDALQQQMELTVLGIDWISIIGVAEAVIDLGMTVEPLLDAMIEAEEHGIDEITVAVTIKGWNPVQVISISSITMVTANNTYMILPKEHITLEQAMEDFDSLSLDLVDDPTGFYSVDSREIFFYNSRNADESDNHTLESTASDRRTDTDILVISIPSDEDLFNIIDPLHWAGVWSALVDKNDQTDDYLGDYSKGSTELHTGFQQIRYFAGRPAREMYVNGSFYYDPGDVLEARTHGYALPAGVVSDDLLHKRLSPREETRLFKDLSTETQTIYEYSQIEYSEERLFVSEYKYSRFQISSISTKSEFSQFEHRKVSDNLQDIVPSEFLPAVEDRIQFDGVVLAQLTDGEASFAYLVGEYVHFGIEGIYIDDVEEYVGLISDAFTALGWLNVLSKNFGRLSTVVGVIITGYYAYKFTQAGSPLEAEYYIYLTMISGGDVVFTYNPLGAVVNFAIFSVTSVLSHYGVLSESYTFTEAIVDFCYWLEGCDDPEERMDELEDIQEKLEEIYEWLEDTMGAHYERGEIAFLIGSISLEKEAQELIEDVC